MDFSLLWPLWPEWGSKSRARGLRSIITLFRTSKSTSMPIFSQIEQRWIFPYCETCDPNGGQGVKLEVWSPLEYCSGPQSLQACQFSAKSNRGGFFPYCDPCDPNWGQGVELEVWGPLEHCSGHQNLQAYQFSAKSNRGGFFPIVKLVTRMGVKESS